MTTERYIRIIAGLFIAISLALGARPRPVRLEMALAFTAFVGANLFQFGFTTFCPLAIILRQARRTRRRSLQSLKCLGPRLTRRFRAPQETRRPACPKPCRSCTMKSLPTPR